MRYTLKDYQTDAVRDVLKNLRKARKYLREDEDRTQFSLSATTGAGKTVIAAAVIEALFFGSDEFDFEADPGAVVLWFSDSPPLNEQSRARIQAASDKLDGRLVPIPPTFSRPKLDPQTVYFLNTQKLSTTARLGRGAVTETEDDTEQPIDSRPDDQQVSFWDTLTNTIEDDTLTLYFVLDEAHRGMKAPSRSASEQRTTIVQRLINGQGTVPPLPIVWGISATVERFSATMGSMRDRMGLSPVEVDSADVQASGLLKDDIVLYIPTEPGQFDTSLLKCAIHEVIKSTTAWADYARAQGDVETVVPLLVVQMPDKADNTLYAKALAAINEEWPSLEPDAFAHVLGEHTDLQIGRTSIDYVPPEQVQDASHIRVLFAKTAISTGWDCPRAEVMVSFRPARDATHITQLLGRMVRTPLARRIPGNEVLNSVHCLLPHFDHVTATSVADRLMRGGSDRGGEETGIVAGGGEGRRVLFDPVQLTPNPDVPASVLTKYLELPSETIPRKNVKPIKRLTALAQALSNDKLVERAGIEAHRRLHKVIDGLSVRYAEEFKSAIKDIETIEGKALRVRLTDKKITDEAFVAIADRRAIDDAYRDARRAFSDDLARSYAEHLTGPNGTEDTFRDAHVKVAALARIPEIVPAIEEEADKLTATWLDQTRVERRRLSDRRQQDYDDIEAMSTQPQKRSLRAPTLNFADSKKRDAQGNESPIPTYSKHLVADSTGAFPIEMNELEKKVLETELARPGSRAWYRNPSRASKDALVVAYKQGQDEYRALCPDFIFFTEMEDGQVAADIVDPHSHHLADALPKLQGLVRFAERYGADFNRIEAVSNIGDDPKVLDLKKPNVAKAVLDSEDAQSLYRSAYARDYR